jgi:predicted nucleic acid-binding protein
MPQVIYISDTNIWSHFRHAGLLAELFGLPMVLASTDFVLFELPDGEADLLKELGLQVEMLDGDEISALDDLKEAHGNSALADVSCYFVAKKHGHPLLTGDGQLRKQATKDGLEVHGALWLLDQLVAHQIIATAHAAAALQAMLDAGARLPHDECGLRMVAWLA